MIRKCQIVDLDSYSAPCNEQGNISILFYVLQGFSFHRYVEDKELTKLVFQRINAALPNVKLNCDAQLN